MKQQRLGILLALAAALCFGAIPTMVKAATAGGAGVLALLSVRYVLASAVLVPSTLIRERGRLPAARPLLKIMAVAGVFLALEAGLYFYSLTLLPSAFAALILFTFPLIVNVLGLFSGKRIRASGWVAMAVCLCGLAALLGPDFTRLNFTGVACAFLAAVSYAVYLVLIDRLISGVSPAVTNAAVSLSNAVTMTAAALATGSLSLSFRPAAWIAILLMVAVSNVAGFQCFFGALKKLGPGRTSVLNMAEPLFTLAIAVLFLGEKLSALQAAGALALVAGLFAFTIIQTKTAGKAPTVAQSS